MTKYHSMQTTQLKFILAVCILSRIMGKYQLKTANTKVFDLYVSEEATPSTSKASTAPSTGKAAIAPSTSQTPSTSQAAAVPSTSLAATVPSSSQAATQREPEDAWAAFTRRPPSPSGGTASRGENASGDAEKQGSPNRQRAERGLYPSVPMMPAGAFDTRDGRPAVGGTEPVNLDLKAVVLQMWDNQTALKAQLDRIESAMCHRNNDDLFAQQERDQEIMEEYLPMESDEVRLKC